MGEIIKVGMADYKIGKAPDSLTTIGLGSCVGVVIYDSISKIAGLAHVMLPYCMDIKENFNVAKYADTAIPKVIEELTARGCLKSRLKAKMAGGSQMFAFENTNEILKIGVRNSIACKEILDKLRIPILSQDIGGNQGRTIIFDIISEVLQIKVIGSGTKEI